MKKICIIPAAGKSTRLLELGKHYPKTCLPFMGKPIIAHIIERVQETYKPDLIVIGTNDPNAMWQIHQAIRKYHGVEIQYFDDSDGPRGPGRSLYETLAPWVEKDMRVLLHLSDSLFPLPDDLDQRTDFIGYGLEEKDFHRWCYVDHGINFYNKPKEEPPTFMAVSGIYGFSDAQTLVESALKVGDFDGEFQISQVIAEYHKTNPMVATYLPIERDFGTLEEYIANKGIPKARSFNSIRDMGKTVGKSSSMREKLFAEAAFIQNQPSSLAEYYPRILKINGFEGSYEMEKIRSTNLRDLYLYMDRSKETWQEIFSSVDKFFERSRGMRRYSTCFWDSFFQKNEARMLQSNFDLFQKEEAESFLSDLEQRIKRSQFYNETTYHHGDLHFANMFYCFTYKDLKLVDPRGEFHGHFIYDLAKLYHSAVGKYDWIDAELYDDSGFFDAGSDEVTQTFERWVGEKFSKEVVSLVRPIAASLFLSMIPLHSHSEKNQRMFYEEFRRLSKD